VKVSGFEARELPCPPFPPEKFRLFMNHVVFIIDLFFENGTTSLESSSPGGRGIEIHLLTNQIYSYRILCNIEYSEGVIS
jgi:hypothetical protein